MDAKTIIDQTEKYYLPVFGRYQLALTHGKGCKLYDADGNEYLDFLAGIAVNSLGHAHPALVKAISEQAAKLMHCSNIYYTDIQAKAVKEIIETTGFDRVFLANSGAEANEGAIKLARKYGHQKNEGKYRIITAVHSFHGRTMMTVTATGQPKYSKDTSHCLQVLIMFLMVIWKRYEKQWMKMFAVFCSSLFKGKAAFMFPVIHTCMKQDYCAINMTHCLFLMKFKQVSRVQENGLRICIVV